MRTCPICGYRVVGDVYSMDDGTTEEEEQHCTRCGYWYYYAYGDTQVRIGEQTWEYGYNDENPDNARAEMEIEQAIAEARATRELAGRPR